MEIDELEIWEDVLPEDYLKLSNGKIVKNLVDLVEGLHEIDEDGFSLHVCESYNDFENWISETYGDRVLADKIRKIKNKNKLIKLLNKIIKKSKTSGYRKISAPKGKKRTLKMLRNVTDGL